MKPSPHPSPADAGEGESEEGFVLPELWAGGMSPPEVKDRRCRGRWVSPNADHGLMAACQPAQTACLKQDVLLEYGRHSNRR